MHYPTLEYYIIVHLGVSPGEGTGATMSDDEEDQIDQDINVLDEMLDGNDDMGGFGLPTERERSLMERVRQELKHELKQVERSVKLAILQVT